MEGIKRKPAEPEPEYPSIFSRLRKITYAYVLDEHILMSVLLAAIEKSALAAAVPSFNVSSVLRM